jgi:hypothetical protein
MPWVSPVIFADQMWGVLLVADPQARAKPCLRCGYSLRHIAGGRNCPECGLAVRVSLGGNDGLEWCNPAWQRKVAMGAVLVAIAQLLEVVDCAVAEWALSFELLRDVQWRWALWNWAAFTTDLLRCILVPLGMILLAWPERRYPETLRFFRMLLYSIAGTYVLFRAARFVLNMDQFEWFWDWLPEGIYSWVWRPLNGPGPIVIRDVAMLLFMDRLAHRGRRHRFDQVILWVAILGLVCVFLDWRYEFRYQHLVVMALWQIIYPVLVAWICIWIARLLRHHAREAEQNWVSDL